MIMDDIMTTRYFVGVAFVFRLTDADADPERCLESYTINDEQWLWVAADPSRNHRDLLPKPSPRNIKKTSPLR